MWNREKISKFEITMSTVGNESNKALTYEMLDFLNGPDEVSV